MTNDPKARKAALAEELRHGILALELAPGSDLDEAELSARHALSRTPLREILRDLAGEGFVQLQQNRGARVSDMSHKTLRDFFLTAPMVYAAVLRLAARNATSDQISALSAAQADFKAALRAGSGRDRALANDRFHRITGEMADNVYLWPSFNRLLLDHARISMTFFRPHDARMTENLGRASDQHDAIIAAIAARDEAAAAALAEDHWNLSRGQIEMFVMPAALDQPLGAPAPARSA